MIGIENPGTLSTNRCTLVARHSITDFPAPQEVCSFFTLNPHGRLMIVIVVLFTRYDFFLNHLKTEAGPLDSAYRNIGF